MVEVLVIGSNVDRERSIQRVLTHLLDLAEPIRVSRIVETPPVGLIDAGPAFLNLAVALDWAETTAALKARLVAIEEAIGRDRRDADCSRKSRRADIDPVLRLAPGVAHVSPEMLPAEGYAREVVVDLLQHLGVRSDDARPPGSPVVEITWGSSRLGRAPVVLTRAAWRRSA